MVMLLLPVAASKTCCYCGCCCCCWQSSGSNRAFRVVVIGRSSVVDFLLPGLANGLWNCAGNAGKMAKYLILGIGLGWQRFSRKEMYLNATITDQYCCCLLATIFLLAFSYGGLKMQVLSQDFGRLRRLLLQQKHV